MSEERLALDGAGATLRVAMVHEVFFDDADGASLRSHLTRARAEGADIAVLPELPLNSWAPGSKVARDADAEPADGPRQKRMSAAAADVGIALLGGAIVRAEDGERHNTALLYTPDGRCAARYHKVHLPEEAGYWETSHYVPGDRAPEVVDALALRSGLQVCSDVNRPQGVQILAAQGAQVIFAPRATPPETYERWRTVLRANAVMGGAYLVSVNRPRPEPGASIGGPSIAIAPSGEVLAESTDPVTIVELSGSVVAEAGVEYPGYLERFPALYARAWERLAD
jgi:N-carbamoylputrescine amidase